MTSKSDPSHTVEWRCGKCRLLPWTWDFLFKSDPPVQVPHYDTLAELEESAATGCYLCRIGLANLDYDYRGESKLDPDTGPWILERGWGPQYPNCWLRFFSEDTISFIKLEMIAVDDIDEISSEGHTARSRRDPIRADGSVC